MGGQMAQEMLQSAGKTLPFNQHSGFQTISGSMKNTNSAAHGAPSNKFTTGISGNGGYQTMNRHKLQKVARPYILSANTQKGSNMRQQQLRQSGNGVSGSAQFIHPTSSGQKLYDSTSRKTFGTLSTQNQKTDDEVRQITNSRKGKYPEIVSSYDGVFYPDLRGENNYEEVQNSEPYLSHDSVGLKSSKTFNNHANSLSYHQSGKQFPMAQKQNQNYKLQQKSNNYTLSKQKTRDKDIDAERQILYLEEGVPVLLKRNRPKSNNAQNNVTRGSLR